jgi:ankyrin repeat protein
VHIAASWGLHDIVKEIVKKHPNLSAVTTTGNTALDLALRAGANSSLTN